MVPVPPPLAIRTAYKNVAQKLHFNLFKPGSSASFALPLARIETERASIQPPLLRQLRLREEFSNIIERPDIHRRIRPRRFAQNGLIHQNNSGQMFSAFDDRPR